MHDAAEEFLICPKCIVMPDRYCISLWGIPKNELNLSSVPHKLTVPDWVEGGNVHLSHSRLLSSDSVGQATKGAFWKKESSRGGTFNLMWSLDAVKRGQGGDRCVGFRYSWTLAVSHEAYFLSFIFSLYSDSFSVGCSQFSLKGCVAIYLFVSWT